LLEAGPIGRATQTDPTPIKPRTLDADRPVFQGFHLCNVKKTYQELSRR
jgi:hypothetical protein